MNSNRGTASKVALVTGASRGIGRATALELAAAGVFVFVNYFKRREDAETVVKTIKNKGGNALPFQADVSDRRAVDAMFNAIDEHAGRLDILVNNAGIALTVNSVSEISDEVWHRTLGVNLDGAFFCLRAAIPRMKKTGGGRIVNVSSMAALIGGGIGGHYAASKGGLLGLTARAAHELAKDGIAVNAVLPSLTETEMVEETVKGPGALELLRTRFPLGRFGRPEEVAQVIRFLCLEAPIYLTGESIRLQGGRM